MILTYALALMTAGSLDLRDGPPARFETLIGLIARSDDSSFQRDLLRGMLDAVGDRRRMAMPAAWADAYRTLAKSGDAEVRAAATRLALIFGDPAAFTSLRALAADRGASPPARSEAIEALAQARDDGLAPVLQGLLADAAVRAPALRGLAATDHPETPAAILKAYPTLAAGEKPDAIGTLAARPKWALALLAAIEGGSVPRGDVPAATLQALAAHTDAGVKAAVARVWGTIRPSSAGKKATIARLKAELTAEVVSKADRPHGRSLFARTCVSCHVLFDAGGKVGPELTGAQRSSLDYLLTNIVDPSGVVAREYQVNVFATVDGRIIAGIVRREDERSVAVQTANELLLIPKSEIEGRRPTGDSMMPEGLLNGLAPDDIRDLIGYLAGPAQVPMPGATQAARGAR